LLFNPFYLYIVIGFVAFHGRFGPDGSALAGMDAERFF
jgi:hypothetical protein